jgi:hypothetical protein
MEQTKNLCRDDDNTADLDIMVLDQMELEVIHNMKLHKYSSQMGSKK